MSEMSNEGSVQNGKKGSNIPSNWAQKWSDEEDKRLLMGIEQYGENNWRMVAKIVGTRDAVKCMQRWEKGLKPGIIKGKWSEEEDRALVYLVSQGYKNWGQVAQHMPGRTSKQCRERWNHYLDPTLIHTPFTEEEDQLLINLQVEHGNKWALIARNIQGRTENAVKLRHHALMKKVQSQQYVGNTSREEPRMPMGRLPSADAHNNNHLHSDSNRVMPHQNGSNGHSNLSSSSDTTNAEHAAMFMNHHIMSNDGMFRRDEERVDAATLLHQQHQQRLYNGIRENNDSRHPLGNFHYQQQQQPQYRIPPSFDMRYNNGSQPPQSSDDVHLNKRQRLDLPSPPLPPSDSSNIPNALQLQQLHYINSNFPQFLHLHQQQHQRQHLHTGDNEAIPWSIIAQPALQIEEVQGAESDFPSDTPNETLQNLANFSLSFNDNVVGVEEEIESDALEDEDDDEGDDDSDEEEDDSQREGEILEDR